MIVAIGLVLVSVASIVVKYKVESFTKVVVPAVHSEWLGGMPDWAKKKSIQEEYGYSVFLYQRLDPAKPNFVKNRGTEGGVYLKYIIDHYDSFPDVAIFVHGIVISSSH